jgi:ectoine hydroxylase-related dioxygenase (phytanoyl-CoA dioxygenase family)
LLTPANRTQVITAEFEAKDAVERDGFAVVSNVLTRSQIDHLQSVLKFGPGTIQTRRAGARNLLDLTEVRNLAADPAVRGLVEPIVGTDAIPVRALFFDKTPDANWHVLWHQDLTIAVAERHNREGWGPWSTKAGVTHVEPPATVLATMLTIRLHLDDCHADNGPLRVIPGSHAHGRLTRERIKTLRETTPEHAVTAPLGSALLMRPLLVHASSSAKRPDRRRVVHVEFARQDLLPLPLAWAQEWQHQSKVA